MSATPKKNDSKAAQRLADYRAEQSRRKIRNIIGSFLIILFIALFFMLMSGDRFDRILSYLGLKGIYNAEKGVYADCSKTENQNIAYCKRLRDKTEQAWESATKGGGSNPFTLFEDSKR